MLFLWFFQVVFIKQFYRNNKIQSIKNVANTITKYQYSTNFNSIVNSAAFEEEVCVEVVDENLFTIYSSSFFGKGCISSKDISMNFKYDFIQGNDNNKAYEILNPRYKNDTLVYAVKLDNKKYAFVNTPIEPIDASAKIIKKQLRIVSIIVLILAILIALFISYFISQPIAKISRSAKELAKGNFNEKFPTDSNISEINELAETLNYASCELNKTDELRRDLMANVSHDLKTPLTMIKAYAEMSKDLHSKNKVKRDEDMNIIISEVDRLTVLVNDILTLSKLQSSIDELNYENFDLVEVIEEIISKYKFLKETENYKFIFNRDKDEYIISADKKKIEQVIYNLINNAINYTGEDNIVTVELENNCISISDTGKGIKEENIPFIWDKYYKNSKKHKRNLVGTGLGLSIVKQVLEAHNYQYGVKSKINNGTTFYFIVKEKED